MTDNKTENEYLQLAKDFQERMDEKNYELEKSNRELDLLKKNFISLYGMLRMMDFLIDNGEIEVSLAVLVEVARGFASDVVDEL
tara:strand:+ start:2265 stop:2516 length:252 start_codon:yes stop_codon:yes gene_type:complete